MSDNQQTSTPKTPNRQPGFCLVTIIVTLALIAVIAALALMSDSG